MKAIRIIAIVLVLVATACGSSADDATQLSSADADPSAAVDEVAADPETKDGQDQLETTAPLPDPADNDDPDGGTVDNGTDNTADDGFALDTDAVGTGLLARVSDATVEAATGRFEGRFVVVAVPGAVPDGSFELTMDGSYDVAAEAFELNLDLSGLAGLAAGDASAGEADMFASMFAEPVRIRSVGDTAWVQWGLLGGMFGALTDDGDVAWIEAELDEAASMTDQFGVSGPESPTDLLQTLAELDATVTELGRETVRGTETTHYVVTIDLEAAAAALPPEDRAELEAELPAGVSGELPIELWLDDSGLLRRLVIQLDEIDSMGLGSDGDEISSATIEFEMYDIGEPMAIEPPPADQVITADELGFGLDGNF